EGGRFGWSDDDIGNLWYHPLHTCVYSCRERAETSSVRVGLITSSSMSRSADEIASSLLHCRCCLLELFSGLLSGELAGSVELNEKPRELAVFLGGGVA